MKLKKTEFDASCPLLFLTVIIGITIFTNAAVGQKPRAEMRAATEDQKAALLRAIERDKADLETWKAKIAREAQKPEWVRDTENILLVEISGLLDPIGLVIDESIKDQPDDKQLQTRAEWLKLALSLTSAGTTANSAKSLIVEFSNEIGRGIASDLIVQLLDDGFNSRYLIFSFYDAFQVGHFTSGMTRKQVESKAKEYGAAYTSYWYESDIWSYPAADLKEPSGTKLLHFRFKPIFGFDSKKISPDDQLGEITIISERFHTSEGVHTGMTLLELIAKAGDQCSYGICPEMSDYIKHTRYPSMTIYPEGSIYEYKAASTLISQLEFGTIPIQQIPKEYYSKCLLSTIMLYSPFAAYN